MKEIKIQRDADGFYFDCPFRGDRNECAACHSDVNFCPVLNEEGDQYNPPCNCPLYESSITVTMEIPNKNN